MIKSSAYLGQFSTQLATVPWKSEDFFGVFCRVFFVQKNTSEMFKELFL